jgi:hypothetical protein
MSPLSWPVVVGTLVVGSPALWAAQVTGTLSPDVAVVRLVLCLLGVWAAMSVVASLATTTAAANRSTSELALDDTLVEGLAPVPAEESVD